MQMILASFLTCFPQALPKLPIKDHHPFVKGIDYFSPFSAPPHPSPLLSGVEYDFSLQNSLWLTVTLEREQMSAESTGSVFVTKRLPAGGGGVQEGLVGFTGLTQP